ncbi:sugar phosphate isomerase/epimerase family protein [Sutcliffiella halmapala]|uniref:sugar phosphate isomerase/epimerase family protein n=1 Tax=Sutcliffiella halmapala TaxID=79882 RepID=UPI000994A4B0|nr:sugar phosphate isomerase/epimerase [Sutcliffiella halmapala]
MKILGYSTGMYGWNERYYLDKKESPSWDQLFRDCAEAGLDAVEIDPTPELVQLAKSYGLSISGAYIGLPLHEEEIDIETLVLPVARRLAEAGGQDLVINADPKGGWGVALPKTEEEFKRQGVHLSRISAAVSGLGLKVSMHNHADDRHNADGDLRSVIEYSSQEVGLCIDTGWAHVAGFDPIEWLKKYSDRTHAFHLRNQQGLIPTEDLLDGEIDMKELVSALNEVEYKGWLTFELWHREDNHPRRTMVEDTKLSIDFLKQAIREVNYI